MRQIKFRVWNTNLNRFMREDEKNDNYMDVTTGKLVSNCYAVHEYGNATEYYNDGSYKLLQFTGLKDKNGVEIYEGDIVKAIWSGDCEEYIANEEWIGDIFFNCGSFDINGEWCVPLNCFNGKFEVIGNIYQNHELLERK